jgi:hypothetical protein
MMKRYSAIFLAYLYDVLVKEAGAYDGDGEKNTFVQAALSHDENHSFEYRFQGTLGFGGKVWLWNGPAPYVTCYKEDETAERKAVVDRTNAELKRLMDEQNQ